MDTTEKVVIGVAVVALVALLIAKYREDVSPLDQPIDEAAFGDQNYGPAYLLGNMPWAYQPWVGNVLTQTTTGQVGQSPALTQAPFNGRIGAGRA